MHADELRVGGGVAVESPLQRSAAGREEGYAAPQRARGRIRKPGSAEPIAAADVMSSHGESLADRAGTRSASAAGIVCVRPTPTRNGSAAAGRTALPATVISVSHGPFAGSRTAPYEIPFRSLRDPRTRTT